MKRFLLLIGLIGVAASATAQQSFAPPEGCEGKLTVQQKGCVVINVWTCEADDPGDQWIALIGEGGLFSIQRVDSEFQWLESYKMTGDEKLLLPAPDPSSLTELFANQVDTFDFTLETEEGERRNVGFDQLTGKTAVIDGETLLITEYQGQTFDEDGNQLDSGAGRQFVSEEHRMFFFGQSWDTATPDNVTDMSPVEFIYPGEPGFFAARPKFECGVIESGYRP